MRRWLVLAAMIGCSGAPTPGPAPGPTPTTIGQPRPEDPDLASATRELIAVTARGDAAAIRAMLEDPIGFGGVWFEDAACRRKLSTMGTIQGAGLDALAACLATLRLSKSTRSNPYPDVAVLTYGPGLEIEARFALGRGRPRVAWIGYVSRRVVEDALPTITQRALQEHRVDGVLAFDPATRARIDGEYAARGVRSGSVWLKVCIDASGAVTSIQPRQTSSRALQEALAAAIKQWTFQPVILGGQPSPVCSLVGHDDPAGSDPAGTATFPDPVPAGYDAAIVVAPTLLKRVEGNSLLVPDDDAKAWIQQHGIRRVTGTFFFCITPRGTVDVVIVQRPTGVPRYDGQVGAGIRGWRYAPFLVDGRPAPVCTHITMIYSQR